MMRPYPVLCTHPGCRNPAGYKIAARWSDGVTDELKTYSLSCVNCLAAEYQRAREKQSACRLTRGETLEAPGIYRLDRMRRDRELARCHDLEHRPESAPSS